MPTRFTIRFRFPEDDNESTLIHRARNWGEALLEPVVGADRGKLGDIDGMTDSLEVVVALNRHVGAVRETIAETLSEHNLTRYAAVNEESVDAV